MLISGKMSVGMDTMADTPSTRISAANTKNVCGLQRKANNSHTRLSRSHVRDFALLKARAAPLK
jgi:hypothetical protein